MANDCVNRLLDKEVQKKLFGDREIPESTVRKMLAGVEAIKKAYDEGHMSLPEFNRDLDQYIRDSQLDIETQAQLKLQDKIIKKKAVEFLNQPGVQDQPVEALHAMLTKGNTLLNDGNISIDAVARGRALSVAEHMRDGLGEKGLLDIAVSGALDDEIALAMDAMTRGVDLPAGVTKEAQEIAKVFKEVNDLVFLDTKNAGLPINYRQDRISLQTHNPSKVKDAGFGAWASYVKSLKPDISQLGPHARTPEGLMDVLRQIYDDITEGKYGRMGNIEDGSLVDSSVTARISTGISSKRILSFGAKEQMAYNRQFGNYESLMSTVFFDAESKYRKVSLYERLGDKPRETFESLIDRQISTYTTKRQPKLAEKLKGSKQRLMNEFDTITGQLSIPGNETIATIAQGVGAIEAVSKLGFVGIRSTANYAGAAMQLKNATGKNFLQAHLDLGKEFFATLPKGVQRTWSKELGDVLQIMHQGMSAQIRGNGVPGKLGAMAEFMMKINGQDVINQSAKNAYSALLQREWAMNIGKNFDELHPNMQASFLQMGLTKEDWGLFKHALEDAPNGNKYVTPEAFGRKSLIPKEELDKVIKAKGLRKMSAEKYSRQIESKMRAYLIQASDLVTTTAGSRERSALTFGQQAGTLSGEFVRMLMRFKSFTLQGLNIGKTFMNANVNPELLSKGILKSEGTNYANLAQWSVSTMAMAYLADTMIRLGQGKEAKDPTKVDTWVDALAKSGVGGMQWDIVNGEWDKYSIGAAALGPTFGNIESVGKIATYTKKALKGEKVGFFHMDPKKEAAKELTKMVRNYIPFQQALGVRQALDYAQYKVINEALYPGSSARYERRVAREKMAQRARELKGE